MDHQKIKELISSYHDGELGNKEKQMLEEHLEQCAECRREFEEMGKFEEVMGKMQLKKPQKTYIKTLILTKQNKTTPK